MPRNENTLSFATKIIPRHSWNDLALTNYKKEQLREICKQLKDSASFYEKCDFDKLGLGRGLTLLFSGTQDTEKTIAAEIIAHELHLDLYKIDLSVVVNKHIGETEKNLRRVFDAAEERSVILFFDEANALFGKRTEVKDSHDRYANIEVNYLLQRMEDYRGLTILATNQIKRMDEAFSRRMKFVFEFSPNYPGVYVQEIPTSVRTITGVATSITAFVGRTLRGPTDKPIMIYSFSEFERIFGGLWKESNMSYAVYQYFQNGGHYAIIVRVTKNATEATFRSTKTQLKLKAANPGLWGENLIIVIATAR